MKTIAMNQFQIERKSEIQLDEVVNILDTRFLNAQNIVQNLSYSTSLKQLYLNSGLGTVLDSYTLFTIQSELKNTMASGGLSVYQNHSSVWTTATRQYVQQRRD